MTNRGGPGEKEKKKGGDCGPGGKHQVCMSSCRSGSPKYITEPSTFDEDRGSDKRVICPFYPRNYQPRLYHNQNQRTRQVSGLGNCVSVCVCLLESVSHLAEEDGLAVAMTVIAWQREKRETRAASG